MKLFISHSVVDYDIVSKFVELIRLGADIPNANIFCTSEPDTLKKW